MDLTIRRSLLIVGLLVNFQVLATAVVSGITVSAAADFGDTSGGPLSALVAALPEDQSSSNSVVATIPFAAPVPKVASTSSESVIATIPFVQPAGQISTASDKDAATTSVTTSIDQMTDRPAASGFWTGPDPFSFVTPSDWSSSLTSSVSDITTVAPDENSATDKPSTSVSTNTHYVIASDTPKTSALTTSDTAQAPMASSGAARDKFGMESWVGLGMVLVAFTVVG